MKNFNQQIRILNKAILASKLTPQSATAIPALKLARKSIIMAQDIFSFSYLKKIKYFSLKRLNIPLNKHNSAYKFQFFRLKRNKLTHLPIIWKRQWIINYSNWRFRNKVKFYLKDGFSKINIQLH
jgi:hypothetical protein